MANSTEGRTPRSLPNFYSSAGQMAAYRQAPSAGQQASSAQQSGEKVKQVQTLLEVVRKLDQMESDPGAKKLTAQIVSLVEQYMEKVQPGAGSSTAAGAATGEAGAGTPTGAGPETTGATAGAATAGAGAGA